MRQNAVLCCIVLYWVKDLTNSIQNRSNKTNLHYSLQTITYTA